MPLSCLSVVIIPAVGKSGPGIYFIKSLSSIFGFLLSSSTAFITSVKLCGGIFVAMPTAIPEEPLTNKFGILVGRTTGSISVSS